MPLDIKMKEVKTSMYTKDITFFEETVKDKKALRSEEVLNSFVVHDGYMFDADEKAMDRMDRVVDIANWQFNRAMANGVDATTAYDQIYNQTTIPWKTADNQLVTLPIVTICAAQEKALYALADTWVKYG